MRSLLLWLLLAGGAVAEITPERAAELEHLVKQDCGSCHGLRMTGGLGSPITPEALAGRPPAPDRISSVRALAAKLKATILLKGTRTVIAAPDGRVAVDTASSPWAATPGSGDVLTGICTALLAAGFDPLTAGACATRVHSRASARAAAGGPTSASAISAALPEVLRLLLSGDDRADTLSRS